MLSQTPTNLYADESGLESSSDSNTDEDDLQLALCGDEPPILLPARETNRDVPPEYWALTISQWHAFLASCIGRPEAWEEAVQDEGYPTCYSLNEIYVRPWTRRTGSSIALRINAGGPLQARLMTSHGWAEDINECSGALLRFCDRCQVSADATAMWFCLYAIYQPGDMDSDPGPTIQEQLARDPFGCVIRCVKDESGMIVVHTSKAEVYNRLWCVYEIAESLRSGSMTQPVCSLQYLRNSRGKLRDVLKVRTQNASCSSKEDQQLIYEHVRRAGGFKALDEVIFKFRLNMLQRLYNERTVPDSVSDDLPTFVTNHVDLGRELSSVAKQIQHESQMKRLRACFVLAMSIILVFVVAWCVCAWIESSNSELPSSSTTSTTEAPDPSSNLWIPPPTEAPTGTPAAHPDTKTRSSSRKIQALLCMTPIAVAIVGFAMWRVFRSWRESSYFEARLAHAKVILECERGSSDRDSPS